MALYKPGAESLLGVMNVIPAGMPDTNTNGPLTSNSAAAFSAHQKEYLDGFLRGIVANHAVMSAQPSNTHVTPSVASASQNNAVQKNSNQFYQCGQTFM